MRRLLAVLLACGMLMAFGNADARVKGVCETCHTMHNSEENQPVAMVNGVWSGGTTLSAQAGTAATPNQHLLVTDCIGCHSSSDSTTTIVTSGANRVPIVYNLGGYPSTPLAGGNFVLVAYGNTYGHHVMQPNGNGELYAPGLDGWADYNATDWSDMNGGCGSNNCHMTLFRPTSFLANSGAGTAGTAQLTGCQGCHYYQFHHKAPGAYPAGGGNAALGVQATYRYLSGHGYTKNIYVNGIEDSAWESGGGSNTHHNVYAAPNGVVCGIINSTNHSITAFCAACHTAWISGSSDGVWTRHPVDVLVSQLVTDGLDSIIYNGSTYNVPGEYDPAVPVAYSDLTGVSRQNGVAAEYQTVTSTTGEVTCLSCHRAHGTNNAYMLRFDYSQTIAGNGTVVGGPFCFTCHTDENVQQ